MVDSSDWRLKDQSRYLQGATLVRRIYRPYPNDPSWDHDHCEFCFAKFATADVPGTLHRGYTTRDEYRWICETCFDDFRKMFEWTVVPRSDRESERDA